MGTTSKISRVKQVLISLISRLIKVFCVKSESATVKSPSVLHPKETLLRSCMSNITNLDKVDPFADAAFFRLSPPSSKYLHRFRHFRVTYFFLSFPQVVSIFKVIFLVVFAFLWKIGLV